jgi:hypothetical protein
VSWEAQASVGYGADVDHSDCGMVDGLLGRGWTTDTLSLLSSFARLTLFSSDLSIILILNCTC